MFPTGGGSSGVGTSASQPSAAQIRCSHCSRFFNSERGLRVHCGKIHKFREVPLSSTSQFTPPTQASTPNYEPFWQYLSKLKSTTPVLKRVPRGARPTVAQCLSKYVRCAARENTKSAWEQLLTFPYRVLHVEKKLAVKKSLTSQIKENCSILNTHFENKLSNQNYHIHRESFHHVETKVGDGDISGAARILFSSDVVAPYSPETLAALESKHPAPSDGLSFPNSPDTTSIRLTISTRELVAALSSFRCGSAGGLDGLTPQHLKDLTCQGAGEAGESLLGGLTALINLMLSGNVDEAITDILYGANLCALRKKDGGIRPIAVGCTYRRTAAKICVAHYRELLTSKLQPLQVGFGSKGGCEAAVHALSTFANSTEGEVILKVDIKNAFNSVNRDTLLAEVKKELPEIFCFLWQCYRYPSKLIYRDNLLVSAVGCQQGDPLGPAIFSLAINPIIRQLNSKFNVWYLDDGTLGGDVETVLKDFTILKEKLLSIGLELNISKCELFVQDTPNRQVIISKFDALAPGIRIVDKSSLHLLGSPIFDESFQDFIDVKIQNFNNISDRLFKINVHSAFTIIKYCCFGPKFTYILRSSHLWQHPHLLDKIDAIMRNTLNTLLNVALDDRAWSQATLPIRFGGLGVRKINSISLPAFLSSVRSTEKLTGEILANSLVHFEVPRLTDAVDAWKMACPSTELPVFPASQRQWDEPLCRLIRENLLNTSLNPAERARLLAVGEWESGLWLQALPSPGIGTMLDDVTFRLTASLRLGASCVAPHRCHCGVAVDSLGHHGLSCCKSAGRIARHATINDIIRRALSTAGIPAVLEPNGLVRDDGKRPDGMSLLPWKLGRPLVWDATCVDTLAPSYLPATAGSAGAAAAAAETLKRRKYTNIIGNYEFAPFGVETLGSWGPSAHLLFREISRRLVDATRDQRAGLFLGQRIAIAIQRGNAASLLGTFPGDSDVEEFFDA